MIDSEESPPSENEANDEDEEDDEDDENQELHNHSILLNNLSALINHASFRLSDSSPGIDETFDVRIPTTFDKTLPAKHEYLGADLEEVRGRTLFDEGSIVELPILTELEVVLVPGQTLPLTALYPPTIDMFQKIIAKDKTFGVTSIRGISPYGTTAEIFQFREENDYKFKIKAKGRQRFMLLDKIRPAAGLSPHKVLILPEISLRSPLHCSRFMSLDRHRKNRSISGKVSKFDAASTPWPLWVYRQYDTKVLVKKVLEKLRNVEIELYNTNISTDPIDLSYWVAKYLLIEEKYRIKLLSFNTSIERLQYALKLLTKIQKLYCAHCGNYIAHGKDVFSMSIDGPQGMYCNPGGYVHEIITVYNGKGMSLLGESPSLEHTWFPGYGWTISQCSNCECHLGWLFTSTDLNLMPKKFWGLSRKSVTMAQARIALNASKKKSSAKSNLRHVLGLVTLERETFSIAPVMVQVFKGFGCCGESPLIAASQHFLPVQQTRTQVPRTKRPGSSLCPAG